MATGFSRGSRLARISCASPARLGIRQSITRTSPRRLRRDKPLPASSSRSIRWRDRAISNLKPFSPGHARGYLFQVVTICGRLVLASRLLNTVAGVALVRFFRTNVTRFFPAAFWAFRYFVTSNSYHAPTAFLTAALAIALPEVAGRLL